MGADNGADIDRGKVQHTKRDEEMMQVKKPDDLPTILSKEIKVSPDQRVLEYDLEAAADNAERDRAFFVRRAEDELSGKALAGTHDNEVVTAAEKIIKDAAKKGKESQSETKASVEGGVDKYAPPPELTPYELAKKILKRPVLHEADYKKRNNAMAEVIERVGADFESAGFEDLAAIFNAEEEDLEAKKVELEEKGIEPFQAQWLRIELDEIRIHQETLGIMMSGPDKMKDDDYRAVALNMFVRKRYDQMEKAEINSEAAMKQLDKKLDKTRDALMELGTDQDPQAILDKIDKLEKKKREFTDALKVISEALPLFIVFDDITGEYGGDNFRAEDYGEE